MNNNRQLKLGFLYSFLTLALLALILKFGISAAVWVSEILQGNKPLADSSLTDNILNPPQLLPLPQATNSATLAVSGFSHPNEKVDLYLNDFNVKTLDVDSEGKFEGEVSLALGISKIYAVAKNNDDQESGPSSAWEIFYEKEPPMLEITEPQDKSVIKKNANIEIKGKVAITSKVSINEHSLILDKEGNFSYSTRLNEGENKFLVICADPAQNKTEKELTLFFQK